MEDKKDRFGRIYDEYVSKIYRFIYLKVDVRETAEDITSKVFASGWQTYQDGKEIKNIGAFLYRIARNAVVDYYREKGRTKTIPMSAISERMDSRTNLSEMAILNTETEKVKQAIQVLKKDHQDALILHYLEDMPIDEVAAIMNRPPGTVRVMIHRGLKDLRKELDIREI